MKAKLFAVLMAMFVWCSLASAQSYAIRVTFNTNLRAAASLQASIVETAPAGTTLNVVGSNNRWLRIDHDGSEVYMADWLKYSRIDASDQTGTQLQTSSQTASNIDNCCFVDWQCTTDQEWTDGYWAFQNNQCTAPTGSQTRTSSQATSIDPAQIDNCCYAGWQCNTDDDWITGFHAFQTNQCKHPG